MQLAARLMATAIDRRGLRCTPSWSTRVNVPGVHLARERPDDNDLRDGIDVLATGDQNHLDPLRAARHRLQQLHAGEGQGWDGSRWVSQVGLG